MNPLRWLKQQLIGPDRPDAPEPGDLVLLGEPDGEAIAGLWKDLLEQRGIHAVLKTDGIAFVHAPMHIRMYVLQRDLAEAREILELDYVDAEVTSAADRLT